MFGKWRNFHDFRSAVPHRRPSALDVLQILAAPRIGAEGGSRERDGVANAVLLHLANGISQQGVPVAIPPINRDFHNLPQGRDQGPVLVVYGAPAVKMVVMGRHLQKALPGYVSPS